MNLWVTKPLMKSISKNRLNSKQKRRPDYAPNTTHFFVLTTGSTLDIYSWAEKEIPRLFCKAIDILKDNPGYSLKYVSENDPESLRCYPRRPEDGKIDWDRDAEYIHRLIRASGYPFAGAFSFLDGKEKITIWRAELYDDGEKFLAVPGQIAELGKNYFVVITGKGKLKITKWDCKSLICSIRQRLI